MPPHRRRGVRADAEVMRRRLQPQGAVDQRLHRRQSALAEGGLQVDMILMAQAHEDLARSEEHTSELQSLMRISYAVFCLKKKQKKRIKNKYTQTTMPYTKN